MANSRRFLSRAFLFTALTSAPLLGQQVNPYFGTTSTSTYSIGPCDAVPTDSFQPYFIDSHCAYVSELETPGSAHVGFPVHLPTGALITSITTHYFDNSVDMNPIVSFSAVDNAGTIAITVALVPSAPFSGGLNSITVDLVPPLQVDNLARSYGIEAALLSEGVAFRTSIYKFDVNYHLQVSPAPGTATFTDVAPGDFGFQFIEALYASGITAGCSPTTFCPNNPLTRVQMAVFLAKALGLHWPN